MNHESNIISIRPVLLFIILLMAADLHAQNLWERMFTGPSIRRVDALGTTAAGTVLASAEGRLFRSEDDGRSWSVSDRGLLRGVESILGHRSGNVIAIARPTGNFGYLCISEDDGMSWRRATIGIDGYTSFTSIAESPEGVLYAGNNGQYPDSTGLFRSLDSGNSWQPFALEGGRVSWIFCDTGGIIIAGAPAIQRSTDHGESWREITLPGFAYQYGRMVEDSSGAYLLQSGQGIWRSSDRGNSWTWSEPLRPPLSDMVVLSDGAIIGSIPGGFLGSDDGGVHWDTLALIDRPVRWNSLPLEYLHRSGTLLAGNSSGVYRSEDGGRTWDTSSTGIPAMIGTYSFSTTRAILQVGYGAIYHSEDLEHWTKAPFTGSAMVDENGHYYMARDTLLRSTDDGNSWIPLGVHMRNAHAGYQLFSNRTGTIFSIGSGGSLWRSTDLGSSWISMHRDFISNGEGDDVEFRGRTGVHARGMLGLASTTDNGDTWHYFERDVSSWAATVAPDSTLYAIGGWYGERGRVGELYRLPYGDTVWQAVSGARLPGRYDSVTSLVATDDGALFSTVNGRGYRSTNRGMTWSDISAGLPDGARSFSLTIDNELVAVVDGYGVYRWIGGAMAVPSTRSANVSAAITGIAPSPAHDRIRITFTLAGASDTRVEVIDLLGRRVAVPLVGRMLGSGVHYLDCTLGDQPTGIYYIVLTSGGSTITRRLPVVN